MDFRKSLISATIALLAVNFTACGNNDNSASNDNNTSSYESNVSDAFIQAQRDALATSSIALSVPAQSPRDIDETNGTNTNNTITATNIGDMNLCDIHFHKSAEHKGGDFTKYAGNGDGEGYGTGYEYNGTLSSDELAPYTIATEHNSLHSGDTIEVHYVYSSNPHATLGHGLGTCLTGLTIADTQPKLRVESQVYVLVNDENAADFETLNEVETVNSHNQAINIPSDTGTPVVYEGSTTGPGYNETYSPYQVTWSVRPHVKKVHIKTVEKWFEENPFKEEHAHGVRNLVVNPALLSQIQ